MQTNYFMGDMWKNISDMNSMDVMKEMDPRKIGLQMLGFQKSVFENGYNAMVKMQGQAEVFSDKVMKNNPMFPNDMMKTLKKNQEAIKKNIDEGFIKAEAMLMEASGQKESPKAPKKETEPK